LLDELSRRRSGCTWWRQSVAASVIEGIAQVFESE
jgi:hypothetical protein